MISSATNVISQKMTTHSSQQWIQYYNQARIRDRWYLATDGSFRWKDGAKFQYIGRMGLNFQVKPKLRVGAGVATAGVYLQDKLSKIEFRPYQEVFGIINDKKILITSRFRLEERFFKNRLDVPVTHDFNFRFRYQIVFSIPLIRLNDDDSNRLLLIASDEIFINAGKNIYYNVLDRNRVLIGPEWQMSKSLTLGVSYMYQFASRNSAGDYDSDDVIWVKLRHNMDLVKSKPVAK